MPKKTMNPELKPDDVLLSCMGGDLRRLAEKAGLPAPPIHRAGLRVRDARPTGNRVRGWWGGMEGGPASFEEWTATVDDAAWPDLNGLVVRCSRGGTSGLAPRSVPSRYLDPIEITQAPATTEEATR